MYKKIIFFFLISLSILIISISGHDIEFDLYGFIDYSFWYNSGQFLANDFPLFALSDDISNTGSSARSSRIGIDIRYMDLEDIAITGKLEVDFWGDYASSGGAESRPQIRLRHAYITVMNTDPELNYGLLAGQSWSIISSAFPSLINATAGGTFGNPWQRQPQIQFFMNKKLQDTSSLGFKLALTRPMTGSSTHRSALLETQLDAGDASKLPLIESELNYTYNSEKTGFILSLSGALGKEDYSALDKGEKVDVNMIGGYIRLRYDIISFIARFYSGKNLNLWLAGFNSNLIFDDNGQIIDSNKTRGGFAEISISPSKLITIFAGYGIDDPNDQDTNRYNKNENLYFGMYYKPWERLRFGLTMENYKTEFPGDENISLNRLMFNTRFSF